jgi:hypothetical protein
MSETAKRQPEMNVDFNKPAGFKATPAQWIGGGLTAAGIIIAGWSMLNDARNMAQSALSLAEKAVAQTTATQAQLEGALVQLSAKLGRIEGLLEGMRDERAKGIK